MSRLSRAARPALFGLLTLGLAACGGSDAPPAEAPATASAPAPTPVAAALPAPYDGPAAEITITPVGNEMKFTETEFTVIEGQEVRLVFNNTADSPAMVHNVVIVKSAADAAEVGPAGAGFPDDDYVAPRTRNRVLAMTPVAQPGETVEVTFTAPAAGDYPYICTYPGHWAMMKGVMRVTPAPAL